MMPKPKRNVMEEFRLNEISAVDRPAQVPAKAHIIKRDAAGALVDTIAKRYIDPADGAIGFTDVLQECLNNERYYETVKELSPVLNSLDTALRSIAGAGEMDKAAKQAAMRDSIEEFMAVVREHLPDVEKELVEKLDLGTAEDESNVSKGKEETMDKETEKKVAELKKQLTELSDKLGKIDKAKDAAKHSELEGQLTAVKAQLHDLETDTLAKLQEQLEALTADNEALKAKAEMSDAEREYMDELDDEDEKKKFRGMSSAERQKVMTKKRASDEELVVEGQTILKSKVGDAQFAIFKAQADRLKKAEDDIAKERTARENAVLAKRATEELPHFGGEDSAKAAVLKAVDSIEDEDVRKSLTEMLKAGNAAIGAGFTKFGHKGDTVPKSVVEKANLFEKRIDEIRVAEKVSHTKAMELARERHPEEFKAYQESAR